MSQFIPEAKAAKKPPKSWVQARLRASPGFALTCPDAGLEPRMTPASLASRRTVGAREATRMSQTGWTDKRPMSPHMQIWRWHITMLGSILHRATGVALYVGAIAAAAWLYCLMLGPGYYDGFEKAAGSIPGLIVLFGFTLSAIYHALNGVRHLVWDTGNGFTPKVASASGWAVLILAIIGAVGVWLAAGLVPGVPALIPGLTIVEGAAA